RNRANTQPRARLLPHKPVDGLRDLRPRRDLVGQEELVRLNGLLDLTEVMEGEGLDEVSGLASRLFLDSGLGGLKGGLGLLRVDILGGLVDELGRLQTFRAVLVTEVALLAAGQAGRDKEQDEEGAGSKHGRILSARVLRCF